MNEYFEVVRRIATLEAEIERLKTHDAPGRLNAVCDGRLTLASGTPIKIANTTGAGTIYFTPYRGNRIAVYDGSTWVLREFSELSVSVPATTNTPFDAFIYDNAGTLTLETVDWTNDTTRATALAIQDGVYVKSGGATRRYLGTGRTTGTSGQTEDSATRRLLWNYYNRLVGKQEIANSTTHTYGGAAWRSWNADDTIRTDFVVGVLEESIAVHVMGQTLTAAGLQANVGAGLNVTNNSSLIGTVIANAAATIRLNTSGELYPALGYNFLQIVEYGSGSTPSFQLAFMYVRLSR